MHKMNVATSSAVSTVVNAGKSSLPKTGRQAIAERKISDPSSASPKGERYPIPSFFEYRIKAREHDPL
ncbi:MAG TPA: hypothetical protein VFR58_11770 [Flavisolibacter sp.]|nr:hypothetical protein [Flavisolibacter sp.]